MAPRTVPSVTRSLTRALAVLGVLLGASVANVRAQARVLDRDALRGHVTVLADDDLRGRGAGSADFDWAAQYAARKLASYGVAPVLAGADGDSTYMQGFQIPSRRFTPPLSGANVLAFIPGTDPALRHEFVTIGAHLDGQGIGPARRGDPPAVHNSANDNATGSAVVLEVARALAADPPRRSVLVALWGAEEAGILGSGYFIQHAPVPLDAVRLHINLDGVGRFDRSPEGEAEIYALGGSLICAALQDRLLSVNEGAGRLRFRTDDPNNWFRASDHIHFHRAGIPSLFLTDLGSDSYHRPSDDAEFIDVPRLARVGETALALLKSVANDDHWPCERAR